MGATTQIIESISSTGGVEVKGFAGDGAEINDMALLATQLQPVIDDLLNQGVNKIILMSHLQQIALEQELAQLLEGVDIILAAGSNTRLGDANDVAVAFPGHAANFAGSYPIVTNGADGGTTLIVNTDNEFTYLGRLVVEFDAAGNLIAPDLDSIPGDNTSLNGAYAATAANVAAAWGVNEADLLTTAFAEGTKGEQVADITEAVQAVITSKDGEIWGFTDVYLEGERNQVRNQETNLGNLSADAQLEAARDALPQGSVVASLKNGGGIRAQIGSVDVITGAKEPPLANPIAGKPEGAVSSLDIENSLRFNNKLMVFDTTPEGLKAILEHGVADLGNQGRFPQLGGISFSFDPDQPAGSRVLNVAALDANGIPVARIIENGVVSADAPAKISVVTISFLADGGDSYPIKANGENFRYLLDDGTLGAALDETLDLDSSGNTPANALGEQRALREFLAEFHGTPNTAFDSADTPGALDQRIQDLNLRSDGVFGPGLTVVGGVGGNNLFGSAGNDVMEGEMERMNSPAWPATTSSRGQRQGCPVRWAWERHPHRRQRSGSVRSGGRPRNRHRPGLRQWTRPHRPARRSQLQRPGHRGLRGRCHDQLWRRDAGHPDGSRCRLPLPVGLHRGLRGRIPELMIRRPARPRPSSTRNSRCREQPLPQRLGQLRIAGGPLHQSAVLQVGRPVGAAAGRGRGPLLRQRFIHRPAGFTHGQPAHHRQGDAHLAGRLLVHELELVLDRPPVPVLAHHQEAPRSVLPVAVATSPAQQPSEQAQGRGDVHRHHEGRRRFHRVQGAGAHHLAQARRISPAPVVTQRLIPAAGMKPAGPAIPR